MTELSIDIGVHVIDIAKFAEQVLQLSSEVLTTQPVPTPEKSHPELPALVISLIILAIVAALALVAVTTFIILMWKRIRKSKK